MQAIRKRVGQIAKYLGLVNKPPAFIVGKLVISTQYEFSNLDDIEGGYYTIFIDICGNDLIGTIQRL